MEPRQPSPRRRRRIVLTTIAVVVVLLLAAGGVLGGGWYYSGQLLEPANAQPGYGDTSAGPAADAAKPAVLLEESEDTVLPGTWGLVWEGGTARVGPVEGRPGGKVQRPLIDGTAPAAGTKVRMQASVWTTDPRTAHGLDYTDVKIPTELGDAPAWFVPGTSTTWAITVHGRAGARTEALRVMPQLHERGLPVLAVTYRNDGAEGAPASPDGLYHLGGTEWRDVEAAIKYAQGKGATRVLLYGWSMGGAIVGQVLARSPLATFVVGVVLDAPVTNWTKTLQLQAANRGVPTAIVPVAEAVSDWRADIGFDRFDLIANPPQVKPKTLIFHGNADGTVPVQASRDLAAAAVRLRWPLQYVEVPGADHTAEWNVDPDAYKRALDDFLTTVISTS